MRISLERFKSILCNGETSEIVSFLEEVRNEYGLTPSRMLAKYVRLCQAYNTHTHNIQLCSWTEEICDANYCCRDIANNLVCENARRLYGDMCSRCSAIVNIRFNRLSTLRNASRRIFRLCQNCLTQFPNRVFHAESETYYPDQLTLQGLLMPQTINFDTLKFNTREELYMSYQSRVRDYPPLPMDRQTEDVQHSMDGSHSSDPLRHRAGFLYDDTESLPVIPHWLGVELEVEPGPKALETPGFFYKVAKTLRKFTIIKPDGSLGAGGFEICSVPATHKKHYELWADFFETASPLLNSWGTGRCGMHVHMNKAFYADSAMGKALVFVNSTENRPFIELVAGRQSNQYMKIHPKKLIDYRTGAAHGHYDALSISQHTGKTLELRIFRGNVRKAGFFKNLDFADALGHFVHDTSMKALKSQDFLTWVAQDHIRSRYPYFIGWAINHKLFEAKKRDKIPLQIKKFSAPQTVKEQFLETV